MINSFAGLEMSRRALNAFRAGIQVAGHNVANVKTEGYSRQRVNLSTTIPFTSPGLSSPVVAGQIGTGVKVDEIVRIRDEFLDFQYRSEMSALGYWFKVNHMYNTVQLYLAEPMGDGVRAAFDSFWSNVQELQKNPESPAIRRAMVESAQTLGGMIDNIVKGYDQYADMVNTEIKSAVDQMNGMLYEIAALNKQIYAVQASGQNPNDLLDKRDLILDRLSSMIDIDIQEPYQHGNVTGEFFITLNGRALVQGDKVRELVAHAFYWEDKVYYDVQVRDNEFDIVEDCGVALALAVGPEGVHQLNVYRLANGESWTVGGYNPYCIYPDDHPQAGQLVLDNNGNPIPMRVTPATTTEALGLATDFRIQVGSQGTQVHSGVFGGGGNILGAGQPGDSYTFRIGANEYQIDVTVAWNSTNNNWDITSDTRATPMTSAGAHLTVADITTFLNQALPQSGPNSFSVATHANANGNYFSVASNEKYLISISDVVGDLAAQMGMVNPNPVITISVNESDSLETIRNKINEKYQEAYGLTQPEQWVHASLEQAPDQTWYLVITSNVPGEAGRITLMGDEDGNMQTLRRLGLVMLDPPVGVPPVPGQVYREVTAYSRVAEDAYFTFNGISYLSADNKFDKARRIPASDNRNDFSATRLETVSEGIYLELKGVGRTAITVQHHVRGGSVKALEEIRDGMIPQLKAELDEIAWALIINFNAYQYSGYGIGDNINTTGVAFFNQLGFKSGSASRINVNAAVANDVSLIGAAMGMLDENGRASFGKSAGSGSGTNASRIASLQTSKLLNSGTASLGDFYEAYLARIGSEAGRANLMYRAQKNLTEQIDEQRQSVMGVNIDEEMLDILMFNHAFNAMSRYATAIDEMLDRIINGFGIVGR